MHQKAPIFLPLTKNTFAALLLEGLDNCEWLVIRRLIN